MREIVEFIEAQMAVDGQLAHDAGSTRSGTIASWHVDCRCPDKDADVHDENCYTCRVEGNNIIIYDEGGHDEYQARHIARHDPAALLADVEAKRALLSQADDMREMAAATEAWFLNSYADDIERSLAAPYAGRPGFKPEWRLS